MKNKQKKKRACLYSYDLIIMKLKMTMKNRLHRYDLNRPRSRHGHKYNKYKKCLSMMMLLCIKQLLSSI